MKDVLSANTAYQVREGEAREVRARGARAGGEGDRRAAGWGKGEERGDAPPAPWARGLGSHI